MAATVADPSAIRKTTAISQPKISGEMPEPTNKFFTESPTPPSIRTYLKAPPPPMTSSNIAIDFTASSRVVIMALAGSLRA